MIRAVPPSGEPPLLLFDLGGILVRLNSVDGLWPDHTRAPGMKPFGERWSDSRVVYDYETGRIANLADFYRAARSEIGITISEEKFDEVFVAIIGDLYEETVPMLSALQGHFPVMMLSNTNEAHWRRCRDKLGLGPFFQRLFLSYEMGVMKPDLRIFQQVLAEIGGNPQNIWYFDDREDNVAAACRLGINGIVSQGGMHLLGDLRHLNFIDY